MIKIGKNSKLYFYQLFNTYYYRIILSIGTGKPTSFLITLLNFPLSLLFRKNVETQEKNLDKLYFLLYIKTVIIIIIE